MHKPYYYCQRSYKIQKLSIQWLSNLNPEVILTAIILRVEGAVLKYFVYIRLYQHQPSSSFLRPGSFVHFLWVGKRSSAASKDSVASHFPLTNAVALTFSCQEVCWTETSLLPDSNDCVCHSEQWGWIVFKMREKSMICRAGAASLFGKPLLSKILFLNVHLWVAV